jgi:hypothetical protein
VPAIVDRWRRSVRVDIADDALDHAEIERAGDVADDPYLVYGSTLIGAMAWGDRVLFVQLGDGDVVAVSGSRLIEQPVPGDERLIAGETTSLGLRDATASFRIAVADTSTNDIELVMLCTDGYGNAFADPNWRADVGLDLLDRTRREGLGAVGNALPAWLAESAGAGGDDVTMALLRRELDERPSAATTPAAPPTLSWVTVGEQATIRDEPSVASSAPVPRRRLPVIGVLAAILLALVAGLALGWLLRGDDDATAGEPSVPPDSTVPASEETPSTAGTGGTEGTAEPQVIVVGRGIVRLDLPSRTATFEPTTAQIQRPRSVLAGDELWDINSGSLVVRGLDNREVARPELSFAPSGVAVADGSVWIASADGQQVVECTPADRTCSSFGVEVGQVAGSSGSGG